MISDIHRLRGLVEMQSARRLRPRLDHAADLCSAASPILGQWRGWGIGGGAYATNGFGPAGAPCWAAPWPVYDGLRGEHLLCCPAVPLRSAAAAGRCQGSSW